MAAQRITAEENHVQDENDGSDAETKMLDAGYGIFKPHPQPGVVGEQNDEDDREIHEVAMDVLDDEREGALAEVGFARFAHGAVDRVGPERLVIGAAIVITGEAESARCP